MNRSLLIVLLLCSSLCHAQEGGPFKINAQGELELDSTTDLGNYNAFVAGEFHGVYGTSEVKLALIKFVNKRYGITDVFMEIGYSAAWLYNRYLCSGDTAFFSAPLLVYAGKQPNRDFWKQLYQYNKTPGHKITIHGIDFERMEFVKALKLMQPTDKPKPKEIAPILTYIDNLNIASVNSDSLATIYDRIRQSLDNNGRAYHLYYGANSDIVNEILHNRSTMANYGGRNKTMYHNLVEQTEQESIRKFIAFTGMNHANRSDATSLCSLIMNSDPFKNQVTNIAMVCKNCYDLQLPADKQTKFRAPYTYEQYLQRLF
jgi:hypothetical protein